MANQTPSAQSPASPHPATPGRLLRVLGVGFGVAVTIGNTIGAGIFRSAGPVAGWLPDAWVILAMWVLGGGLTLVAVCSFIELGTMIPRSGGHYVFTRYAFGDYPGFVIGWTDWLSNAGSSSAVSIAIGEYVGLLYPRLAPHKAAIACGVVIVFTLAQWRGIRLGSGIQNLTSALKALLLSALVISCFFFAGRVADTAGPPAFPQGHLLFISFILAVQAVVYTNDGWAGIIYFSEETTDPKHDVPRSMFIGTISVTILYILLTAATLKVLPISLIQGKELAIGEAARAIWGDAGTRAVLWVLILGMLSAVNAYQLMVGRIIYSMAQDGLFTKRATHVNEGGTPDFALFLSTLVAIGFILSGTFEQVMAVMAFYFECNYIGGLASVFLLRRREPDHPRPVRAWGYPYTTAFALIVYVAMLAGAIYGDRRNSLFALVVLAASYPVYRLVKKTN